MLRRVTSCVLVFITALFIWGCKSKPPQEQALESMNNLQNATSFQYDLKGTIEMDGVALKIKGNGTYLKGGRHNLSYQYGQNATHIYRKDGINYKFDPTSEKYLIENNNLSDILISMETPGLIKELMAEPVDLKNSHAKIGNTKYRLIKFKLNKEKWKKFVSDVTQEYMRKHAGKISDAMDIEKTLSNMNAAVTLWVDETGKARRSEVELDFTNPVYINGYSIYRGNEAKIKLQIDFSKYNSKELKINFPAKKEIQSSYEKEAMRIQESVKIYVGGFGKLPTMDGKPGIVDFNKFLDNHFFYPTQVPKSSYYRNADKVNPNRDPDAVKYVVDEEGILGIYERKGGSDSEPVWEKEARYPLREIMKNYQKQQPNLDV